jgi:hypothetical protein
VARWSSLENSCAQRRITGSGVEANRMQHPAHPPLALLTPAISKGSATMSQMHRRGFQRRDRVTPPPQPASPLTAFTCEIYAIKDNFACGACRAYPQKVSLSAHPNDRAIWTRNTVEASLQPSSSGGGAGRGASLAPWRRSGLRLRRCDDKSEQTFRFLSECHQPNVGKGHHCGRSSVVERQLPKLYVVGSIPIARSNV